MRQDLETTHVGEKIRDLRESRGQSVRTLAGAAGFSPSFISQVENGQCSPSIGSLEQIAAALDATLGEFFGGGEPRAKALDRKAKRMRLESSWSKAEISRLGHDGSALRAVMITMEPGGSSGKIAHPAPREELAVVFAGKPTLKLDGRSDQLRRGDAATIPAGTARRWSNDTNTATEVLIVTVGVS